MNDMRPQVSPAAGHGLPPAVRDAFDDGERAEIERVWRRVGRLVDAEPSPDDFARMGQTTWQHVVGRLDVPRHSALRLVRLRWTAYAAAAVIAALALGWLWWRQPVTVHATPGDVTEVRLPDGSNVTLNSGSTLTYPRTFGDDARRVHLGGEALFDVVHQDRPFRVETFNAEVRVLGTRFNVRAWPSEQNAATEVTLVEGRVEFASRGPSHAAVVLAPGESSRVTTNGPTPPAATGVQNALAWKDRRFVFVDQPLGKIVGEVERRFGVRIDASPPGILQDSLTIMLSQPHDAARVLRDIEAYLGYRFRKEGDGYVLYLPDAR